MRKCVLQTKAGNSCKNYSMSTSKYCQRHDPRYKEARKVSAKQGHETMGHKKNSKQWNKEHRQVVRQKVAKSFDYDSNIASTFIQLIRMEVRQAIMEIFFPKDKS